MRMPFAAENCGNPVAQRQRGELFASADQECVSEDDQRTSSQFGMDANAESKSRSELARKT
jgi:hypothetical protein